MHIDEINSKLPVEFSLSEFQRMEDKTPFTMVLIQECKRINTLISHIKSSLRELSLLLKVIILKLMYLRIYICLNRES